MILLLLMMFFPPQADVVGPVRTTTDAVDLDVPELPLPPLTTEEAIDIASEGGEAFYEFAAESESEDIKDLAAGFLSLQPQTYSRRRRERRKADTEERTPEEVEEESGGIMDEIRKRRKEIIDGRAAKWDSIKGAAFAAAIFVAVLFLAVSSIVGKLGK